MVPFFAKVDHFQDDLPYLRSVTGVVIPPDADLLDMDLEVGDVLFNLDGVWSGATETEWSEIEHVGVVVNEDGDKVVVQADGGLTSLTVPSGISVEKDFTVRFNDQRRVLAVVARSPIRPAPLEVDRDDGFTLDSVKREPPTGLSWADFAGFPDVVAEIQQITDTQLRDSTRRKLTDLGVPPVRGLIFAGPPGTGKTHLAQIMASTAGAAFYLVTAASLGGRLVGESEGRLEAIYEDAGKQPLSLVFIDEIDVLTKDRDNDQASNSRLVNVFLTNMDGATTRPNVVTIGTTNRISDIDKALRRPGRFDRELTFRYPDDKDRLAILTSSKVHIAGDLDFQFVASNTEGWTAADLQSVWQHAGELTVQTSRTTVRNDFFLMGFEKARTMWEARQETP